MLVRDAKPTKWYKRVQLKSVGQLVADGYNNNSNNNNNNNNNNFFFKR